METSQRETFLVAPIGNRLYCGLLICSRSIAPNHPHGANWPSAIQPIASRPYEWRGIHGWLDGGLTESKPVRPGQSQSDLVKAGQSWSNHNGKKLVCSCASDRWPRPFKQHRLTRPPHPLTLEAAEKPMEDRIEVVFSKRTHFWISHKIFQVVHK